MRPGEPRRELHLEAVAAASLGSQREGDALAQAAREGPAIEIVEGGGVEERLPAPLDLEAALPREALLPAPEIAQAGRRPAGGGEQRPFRCDPVAARREVR